MEKKLLVKLMRDDFEQVEAVSFSDSMGIGIERANELFKIMMDRFNENFESKRDDTKSDLLQFAINTGETPNEIYFMIWIMAGRIGENRSNSTKKKQDATG